MLFKISHPDVNFSPIRGFRFRFKVEGKELLLASAWNGTESVSYDGRKISTLRTSKKSSQHRFTINNVPYQITLVIDNYLKGGWHCCLFRNYQLVKGYDLYLEKRSVFKSLLFGIALGVILLITPDRLWFICIPWILAAFFLLLSSNVICRVRMGE